MGGSCTVLLFGDAFTKIQDLLDGFSSFPSWVLKKKGSGPLYFVATSSRM